MAKTTAPKISTKDEAFLHIRLPKGDLEILDNLIADGVYLNRTDGVRDLIRKAANENKPKTEA